MEKLLAKLSHEEINALPIRSYQGPIHFIREEDEIPAAVERLKTERVLGFDTESRPAFNRGETHPVALLQLGGEGYVYIFRLLDTGLTDELIELLADECIVKAGVAPHDDIKDLQALRYFEPGSFVDLSSGSKNVGMQHHGLRGLAAILLRFRISKSMQRSNWAADPLTEKQIRYAATDAWLSRELFLEMDQRRFFEPVELEEEEAQELLNGTD